VIALFEQPYMNRHMKIAILSDIHDHIQNLEKALEQIKGKVETIICLGDFCAPFSVAMIAEANIPVHAVLGNNDGDQIGLQKLGGDVFHWTPLLKEFGEVELDGRKIAFNHYPKLGELLARTGDYDAVFHGHSHVLRNEYFGKSLLVNPGSVCGIQRLGQGRASYAIYDTESNSAEIIYLD
jgi:uncharacterized protein